VDDLIPEPEVEALFLVHIKSWSALLFWF